MVLSIETTLVSDSWLPFSLEKPVLTDRLLKLADVESS